MKTKVLIISILTTLMLNAQDAIVTSNLEKLDVSFNIEETIYENVFKFKVLDAGINTRFDEYGSGFFMNKFIAVSSRKIGGLDKVDQTTGESDKNVFCFDYDKTGSLSLPLLFSHFINTEDHEDLNTFSISETTMYFTRSSANNPQYYKLYKTDLEPNSNGVWVNLNTVKVNLQNGSIEHPTVTPDGKLLYFSSNASGGFGGFDLYKSYILDDGSLSPPVNFGKAINTPEDDKFPTFSKDGSYLFFASKGHKGIGGYDLFRSRIYSQNYSKPINLGSTINTVYDDVAIYFASNTRGYVSSNGTSGKGGFDIYKFELELIKQSINGKVLDKETLIALPNTTVELKDSQNMVLETVKSDSKGVYNFTILPFENYTICVVKDGFEPIEVPFLSNKGDSRIYMKNILLDATKAEIVEVAEKTIIKVENILFDFDKSTIKEESTIALNKVYDLLIEHQEMTIQLNAHTDQKGSEHYNLNLSKRRAASAKAYLVSKGIKPYRIQSNGFGETKPIINCNSTPCSDKEVESNRRVEFILDI